MPSAASQSTSAGQLEESLRAASRAAGPFGALSPGQRGRALRSVADALEAHAEQLVPLAVAETHLAEARLSGEVTRTTFQLRLFAEVLDEGSYLEATIDEPESSWPPGPRPDLRRMLVPLGPVVVFAASNFPFAFSVAGGDTASALAAGCPVLLKAHPGHPKLSASTGDVVRQALFDAGAPEGTFTVVYGDDVGRATLADPRVRAGAFTGSLAGGRALFDVATSRADPVPFYAEMGSVNPVFVTSSVVAARGDPAASGRVQEIVSGFVESFTLGVGQFCTKPGFLFVPAASAPGLLDQLASAVAGRQGGTLLNDRIAAGYRSGLAKLTSRPGMRTLAGGPSPAGESPLVQGPSLVATSAKELLALGGDALEECFGPVSVVVTYDSDEELLAAARAFGGQLTATVHGEADDQVVPRLLSILAERAGRVLWNGWPTGVSVTWAMQHGGPYPATTAPMHTSVGTAAIARFLRPVSYQSVPDALLPPALQEANPWDLPRRVNGHLVPAAS